MRLWLHISFLMFVRTFSKFKESTFISISARHLTSLINSWTLNWHRRVTMLKRTFSFLSLLASSTKDALSLFHRFIKRFFGRRWWVFIRLMKVLAIWYIVALITKFALIMRVRTLFSFFVISAILFELAQSFLHWHFIIIPKWLFGNSIH